MNTTFTVAINVERYPELWEVLEAAKEHNERSKVARDLMLKGLAKEGSVGDVAAMEAMLREVLSQNTAQKVNSDNDEADKKLQGMFA